VKLIASGNRNRSKPWWASLLSLGAVTAELDAVPMWHLFVDPVPFENWGEHPYNGTTLNQLLAVLLVIVSVGALTLAVCRVLGMLLAG
jgi:hypothetical protein